MAGGSSWARHSVVGAATDMLQGRLGLTEGCRRLAGLAHDVVPDWRIDADFVVFGAVASETDNYPVGAARAHWNPEALEREDAKRAKYEGAVRDSVLKACGNVIARFTAGAGGGPDV
jgi:hypothetical protein